MHLIYLKEGRRYTLDDLIKSARYQVEQAGLSFDATSYGHAFFRELRDAMNRDKESVVRGEKAYVFHYLGLFDFVDSHGKNLTFFFLPKFLNEFQNTEAGADGELDDGRAWTASVENLGVWQKCINQWKWKACDDILLAIDRFNKEEGLLGDETEIVREKRESLLELAVRVLRDYLENGLYIVQRHELERNGVGDIQWEATIERCNPMFVDEQPVYVDCLTEQAYSDEDYYITRLHKHLLTKWGKKLEDLGLSPVLRVCIPPLSEDQGDCLGDADYQIAQIDRELKQQFVTKSRETLMLIKSLIMRATETKSVAYETLSFGMSGVEHLWESACAKVLGSELDEPLNKFGLRWEDKDEHGQVKDMSDIHFDKFMPRIIWRGPNNEHEVFDNDKGSQRSKKAGWRLDFIRTYPPHVDGVKATKLVILDAKYYCARWRKNKAGEDSISGQPGTPDITKQMYYQMVFQDLQEQNPERNLEIVNAFLLPEDDGRCPAEERVGGHPSVWKSETIGWSRTARAFKDVHLYTVRIPGMSLLSRYAHVEEPANDWFEKIVGFNPQGRAAGQCLQENFKQTTPDGILGAQLKTNQVAVQGEAVQDDKAKYVERSEGENRDGGQLTDPVEPIVNDSLSKAFICDVMSVPSVSGKEGLMKDYIRQFAESRGIEVMEDHKGNIYLTKGRLDHDEYYSCLVNHIDTVQVGQEKYVDERKRLTICEQQRNGGTELFVEGMGIGADDKLGCAIALALIDQLSAVKAAFFVEAEKGMLGSKELDLGWFKDVGFCLSFDSPERNRSSKTCAGEKLYSEDFFNKVLKPVCERHGITKFNDERFTDIVQIRQKTPIMCYNVGNGGYRAHSPDEYLVVEDAQAAYAFGKDLLEELK